MTSSHSLTLEGLTTAICTALGDEVRVSTRRPGRVFQVTVPAFLPDGDNAILFVEGGKGATLRVTDFGHTLMRMTYEESFSEEVLAHLESLAGRNGFSLRDGELEVEVTPSDLLAALMGLIQVEACAEAYVGRRIVRGPRPEEFRRMVMDALRAEFGDKLEERFVPPGAPSKDFAVDALLRFERPIVVAAVPSDVEAERAVGTRYAVEAQLHRAYWLAVPKDMDRLSRKSRDRLIKAYTVPSREFDPAALKNRINEFAA